MNGKALSRIEHGQPGKDGKNQTLVFNEGDKVTGLPDDVMLSLAASGALLLDDDKAAAAAIKQGTVG